MILFGAQVANFHAGLLCLGFPLCNGADPPAGRASGRSALDPPGLRLRLSGLVSCVAGGSGSPAAATRPAGALRRWAAIVLAVTVAQIGIAAAMVLEPAPAGLRAAHLLVGSLVWAALVVLVFRSGPTPLEPAAEPADTEPAGARSAVAPGRPRHPHQAADHLAAAGDHGRADVHHAGRAAFARRGSLWVAAGRLPDGRRRQRDQHVVRPGHRHPDGAHPPAADPGGPHLAGLRPGVRRGARASRPSPSSGTRSTRSAPGSRWPGSCSTSSSTPSGSSARARRTSSSAARPARSRRWSDGRR